MPATYSFTVPAPGVNQGAAVSVRLYQSAEAMGAFVQVGLDVLLSSLAPVLGVYTWPVVAADAAKYSRLTFLAADGAESQPVQTPPVSLPLDGTFQLEVWTVDAGLGVVAGIQVAAKPTGNYPATPSGKRVVQKESATTDANGYAALYLAADIGLLPVTVGNQTRTIDTTDLEGQTITW